MMGIIGWYVAAAVIFALGWAIAGSFSRQHREDLEHELEELRHQNARLRARLRTVYGMRRVA